MAVPLPGGTLSAFDLDVAVSSTEARFAWSGLLLSGYFQGAYASVPLDGMPPESEVVPFIDAVSTSLQVHVAALPAGGFAFVWQVADGTIWTAVQEGSQWRGPFATFTSLPDPAAGFDLAASADWLYVAWVEANAFNGTLVVSRVSTVDLYSKSESRVDSHLTARKFDPSLALRGEEAYVAWRRGTSTESAVFFAHGGAVNETWSPVSVTQNLNAPYEFKPQVLLPPDGTAAVAWQDMAPIRDDTGPASAYVARSTVPSETFGPPIDLGAATGAGFFDDPMLAVDALGRLRIAWLDGEPAIQTSQFRVMYSESDAGWSVFTQPQQLNSDSTTWSRDPPAIALVPEDRVLVAWGDRRDGSGGPRPYFVISSGPPAWLKFATGLALTAGGAGLGAGGYLIAASLNRKRIGNRRGRLGTRNHVGQKA